jgi:hypothetical protein
MGDAAVIGRPIGDQSAYYTGCESLAVAVVRRSVLDVRRGWQCDTSRGGRCQHTHSCEENASAFLNGDGVVFFLEILDVDRERFTHILEDVGA